MKITYSIEGYSSIDDYGLIYTAIVNPSKRRSNITYLMTHRGYIPNLDPIFLNDTIEEIIKITESLQQEKTYNYGNYYFFSKILMEIEKRLQDRLIFLEVRKTLEE